MLQIFKKNVSYSVGCSISIQFMCTWLVSPCDQEDLLIKFLLVAWQKETPRFGLVLIVSEHATICQNCRQEKFEEAMLSLAPDECCTKLINDILAFLNRNGHDARVWNLRCFDIWTSCMFGSGVGSSMSFVRSSESSSLVKRFFVELEPGVRPLETLILKH